MATLALGSKVPPLSFYHSLSKITHPAEKQNIPEETLTIDNEMEHNYNETEDTKETDKNISNENNHLE